MRQEAKKIRRGKGRREKKKEKRGEKEKKKGKKEKKRGEKKIECVCGGRVLHVGTKITNIYLD